jgi:hypothetical protein
MSDLILDNFTGTGTLADHTGDSGVVWSPYTPVQAPAFTVLSGGYVMPKTADTPPDGNRGEWGAQSDIVMPASNISILLDLDIVSATSLDYGQLLLLDGKIDLQIDASDRTFYYRLWGTTGGTVNGWTSPYAFGAHTVQVDLTPTSSKLYFDGVLKLDTGGMTGFEADPFSISYDNSGGSNYQFVKLDKLQVSTIGPPPAFWTQNKLTTEVVA